MKFGYLAENKDAIPILANWYFDEWGYIEKGNSIENITNKLNDYSNTDKMPLIILAINGGEILGAAQLKYRESNRSAPPCVCYGTGANFTVPAAYQATTGLGRGGADSPLQRCLITSAMYGQGNTFRLLSTTKIVDEEIQFSEQII